MPTWHHSKDSSSRWNRRNHPEEKKTALHHKWHTDCLAIPVLVISDAPIYTSSLDS